MQCRKIPSEFDKVSDLVKQIDPYGVLEIQDHMITRIISYEICFEGHIIELELPYRFFELCRSDNLGEFIEEFSIYRSKYVMPQVTIQSNVYGIERFEDVVCWNLKSTKIRRFNNAVFSASTSLEKEFHAKILVRSGRISLRIFSKNNPRSDILFEVITNSDRYVPREFSIRIMREDVMVQVVQRGDVELSLSYDPFDGDYSPENVERCWKQTSLACLLS